MHRLPELPVLKKNNGHKVCYSWFKDALLQKNGIIKVWWDTRAEEKREEYKGLTEVELTEILEDPEVEPIEQTKYPDEEDAKQREEGGRADDAAVAAGHAGSAAGQCPAGNQQAVHADAAAVGSDPAQPPAMLYDVSFKRSKKGWKARDRERSARGIPDLA
jgi:hypothetical protein